MDLPRQTIPHLASERVLTRPFVVAVLLLGVAAIVSGPVAGLLDFKEGKQPLPLLVPLAAMDDTALYPYRVTRRHVLPPEIVEALGTKQYLQWSLENRSLPAGHPLREANLFITYYTGGYNLVPHTPDVCYLGNGYEQAQVHENVEIEIGGLPSSVSAVPVRLCTFAQTAVFDRRELSVVYAFYCNGRFVATRTGVRLLINNPMNTYAYFSKVEVNFPRATRSEAVEGAKAVFQAVLPILIRDHWPDFEASEKEAGHKSKVGA